MSEEAATSDIAARLRQEFRVRDWWPGMDSFDSARGETVPHPVANEAAKEIEVLRHVVRVLAAELSDPVMWGWMLGSEADLAYKRAIANGSERA